MSALNAFEIPLLLLLSLPVLLLYLKLNQRQTRWTIRSLHILFLLLIVVTLAGPLKSAVGSGLDLIVVVDRSKSMPPESAERIGELLGLIAKGRPAGSQLGIVSVGARAAVEQLPQAEGSFVGFDKTVDTDGSNLCEGIETALHLVSERRAGRILILSDGLPTGRSPIIAASIGATRRIPIDFRLFERPHLSDVSVVRVQLPSQVDSGSAFQMTAWVQADQPVPIQYRVFREKTLISSGGLTLPAGRHPLFLRDRVPRQGGVYRYRIEVDAGNDPIPENNIAEAVLRVEDLPRILLVTTHDPSHALGVALTAGTFSVDTLHPGSAPRDLAGLDPYRLIILEDVSANDLGWDALEAIRDSVEDGGCGLLVTGGRASFGLGGYFKSILDPILPVSMELRQEQRRFDMAMAVALDRSGSMSAVVAGGMQKMDLANQGAVEAIRLLGPRDQVSVIAVDSSPHTIIPLTRVEDQGALINKVLGIRSMGGGIFIYEALVEAGNQLAGARAGTKHIVLFADAADSEEPGDYKVLLEKYVQSGITVSVIGMGTDSDVDADLLKDVAMRGKGRIFFADRPEDLPRLFALETLSAARAAFVEEDSAIPAKWHEEIRLIGEVAEGAFPGVRGYNLTYLRPNASLGAITQDEFKAPLLAFWHRKFGRVAAFTAEADGPTSAGLLTWTGYPTFFGGLGRWLMGTDAPPGASLQVRIEEPEVIVKLEFDPSSALGAALSSTPPDLTVYSTAADAGPFNRPFEWTGERSLEARFTMDRTGIYLPAVKIGALAVLKAPPVTLPYSPEFLPREAPPDASGRSAGRITLEDLSDRTGGQSRENVDGIFDMEGTRAMEKTSLRPLLAIVLLILLLLEIAARRLHLWDLQAVVRWERAVSERVSHLRRKPAPRPAEIKPAPTATHAAPAAPAPPPSPSEPETIQDALASAKARARRRFGGDR